MKTTKNIARLAVTAGLTAALSFGGVMAPVTMAFAEGTPTVATEKGKVAITDNEYAGTSFKGIQIFAAKVTQGKKTDGTWDDSVTKTLSDIKWASADVKNIVTTALAGKDGAPSSDADAQEWAEFISRTQGSNHGKTTAVDADTTLDLIAKGLEEDKKLTWTNPSNSSKGNFENLDHGYWLFVTDVLGTSSAAEGNTDAYTSPIFTIVGGSDVNVTPKKDVPTVTKAVKDDNNGSFVTDASKDVFEAPNRVADSASDQLIEYQLAGTVASNINSYKEYSYTFTDGLPSTMVPELVDGKPVVEVKIGDKTVKPEYYDVRYNTAKNELVVSFGNLKKEIKSDKDEVITVSGSSKIYVNYKAKLDPTKVSADMLGKGQKNTVTLTYSNNPHDNNGTGTTVDHPAYDYTYGIDVKKVGSDEAKPPLANVEFTLQEVGTGKFIKRDGTTTSNETEDGAILKTDSNGKIKVLGLDEGTYVLKEKTPAPGYNNSHGNKGITFTITRGTLSESDATVVNPAVTVTDGDNVGLVENDNSTGGMVHLTVTDKKGSNLPLTGLNGVTFTWIAGGAVLCIGVAHLIRSRKRDDGSEE